MNNAIDQNKRVYEHFMFRIIRQICQILEVNGSRLNLARIRSLRKMRMATLSSTWLQSGLWVRGSKNLGWEKIIVYLLLSNYVPGINDIH